MNNWKWKFKKYIPLKLAPKNEMLRNKSNKMCKVCMLKLQNTNKKNQRKSK